ncbi:MAG: hypothetical protein AB1634_14925 [Thermodesulfobacteriota bacterium]
MVGESRRRRGAGRALIQSLAAVLVLAWGLAQASGLSELQLVMTPGTLVQVRAGIDKPAFGWGEVGRGELGQVASYDEDGDLRVDFPGQKGWLADPRELEPVIGKGMIVVRGPDWKWGDQDGGRGGGGTVVESKDSDSWITVKWDNGNRNNYRWGADGKYDLEVLSYGDGSAVAARTTTADADDDTDSCTFMYEIYRRCFGAGIGESVDTCAEISAGIITKLSDSMSSELSSAVGLLCGIACAEGSRGSGLPAFDAFKAEYCD